MSESRTAVEHMTVPVPIGIPGESCFACGALMAEDQRYCLNCGERRGQPRVPLHPEAPATRPAPPEPEDPSRVPARLLGRPISIGAAVAGIAVLLLAGLVGVLIGNSGDNGPATAAAPPRPQVITIATPGAGAASAADQTFTSDWPDGTDGYTVQLQTLSKDASDPAAVATAKSAALDKGAPAVGALDSDDFESLDSGNYVVYSGVFKSKTAATKGLKKLKDKFPGARVVAVKASGGSGGSGKKVNKGELKDLQNSSPQDYQKKSKKLPDKLKTPGKAPPKDDKKAGGGGKVETIG
jgi:hypothetical protein